MGRIVVATIYDGVESGGWSSFMSAVSVPCVEGGAFVECGSGKGRAVVNGEMGDL